MSWGWVAEIDEKKFVIPDDIPSLFHLTSNPPPGKFYDSERRKRAERREEVRKYLNDAKNVSKQIRALIEEWYDSNSNSYHIWELENHPNPPPNFQRVAFDGSPSPNMAFPRQIAMEEAKREAEIAAQEAKREAEIAAEEAKIREHQRRCMAVLAAATVPMIFSSSDLRPGVTVGGSPAPGPSDPQRAAEESPSRGSQMQRAIEASLRSASPLGSQRPIEPSVDPEPLPTYEESELERVLHESLQDAQQTSQPGATLPDEPVQGDGSCVVCFEGTAEYVVASRGHRCLCKRCAATVDKCPLCNEPKTMEMHIFISGRELDEEGDPEPVPKKRRRRKKKKKPSWEGIPKDQLTPEQRAERRAGKFRKLQRIKEKLGPEEYRRRVREHNAKIRRKRVIKPRAEWAK